MIYLNEPGKIGTGYQLVIILKRAFFGSLLGLSAMTDKIFNAPPPFAADIYQCSSNNIPVSSSRS